MKINAKYAYTTPSYKYFSATAMKKRLFEAKRQLLQIFSRQKVKGNNPGFSYDCSKKENLGRAFDAIENHTAGQSVVITITLKSNKVKDESQSSGEGPPKSHYPFSNFVRQ